MNIQEIITNEGTYFKDRNAYVLGKEPMIFHCHHYNCFLQQTIESTGSMIDPYPILVDSAHSVVYSQIRFLKDKYNLDDKQTLELGKEIFRSKGFGILEFESIGSDKGIVIAPVEHYGVGWKARYQKRNEHLPGVAFFARGFIEALIEVAYDLPKGTIESEQIKCISKGDEVSKFDYKKSDSPRTIIDSPQEGEYNPVKFLTSNEASNIDYIAVRDAVLTLPLAGDEKTGLIEAFGVWLTQMYANYYTLVTYGLIEKIKNVLGEKGMPIVEMLLKEAGHVCAFNTLGAIMCSAEWDAVVIPQIKEDTDWLHGIVAVMNALGWGTIEVHKFVPGKRLELIHYSDYENNAFIKLNMQYDKPSTFLFQGGNAGLMNLLYNIDITQRPALTPELYKKVFKPGNTFLGSQIHDRRLDGEYSVTVSEKG